MPLRIYLDFVLTAVAALVGVGVTVVAAVGLLGAAFDVVLAVAFADVFAIHEYLQSNKIYSTFS